MSKKIKMVLYGEPGVGKSVFASKAPKPFFICTDGNYEWLVDFGAKEEDHVQVNSWEEAKKIFTQPFDKYDTIVVDLVEDLFKWCEQEFCKRNKLEHISDQGYGKGYDITRNEFFLEISKLLAKDKHIILLSHGITSVVKDRRGVEKTIYLPSTRIPDKVWDMIEGRVRYFLRCYLQAEQIEDNNNKDSIKLVKKRYLSLIPKENEFGISRGLDEAITPHDILLDFNEFAKAINLDAITTKTIVQSETKTVVENVKPVKIREVEIIQPTINVVKNEEESKPAKVEVVKIEETPKVEVPQNVETTQTVESVSRRTRRTRAEAPAPIKISDNLTVEELEKMIENETDENMQAILKSVLAQHKLDVDGLLPFEQKVVEESNDDIPTQNEIDEILSEVDKNEIKEEPQEEKHEEVKIEIQQSRADKMAAIKAKLAASHLNNN